MQPPPRCSFCNKSSAEVKKLITGHAGPPGAAICDECVDVCNDIVGGYFDHPPVSEEEVESEGGPDLFPFRCPECGHRWKAALKR